jgi:hypothetical protein
MSELDFVGFGSVCLNGLVGNEWSVAVVRQKGLGFLCL